MNDTNKPDSQKSRLALKGAAAMARPSLGKAKPIIKQESAQPAPLIRPSPIPLQTGKQGNSPLQIKRPLSTPLRTQPSSSPASSGSQMPAQNKGLSESEKEARFRALERASKSVNNKGELTPSERLANAQADAQKKSEEDARRLDEEMARRREEEERRKLDEEMRLKAESIAARQSTPGETPAQTPANERNFKATPGDDADRLKAKTPKPPSRSTNEPRRRSGKLTVSQALSDDNEKMRSLASIKRAQAKEKKRMAGENAVQEKVVREITLPEHISVGELANRMAERVSDVIKSLMKMGMIATQSQSIDADTAELVASELGHKVKRVSESDVEDVLVNRPADDEATLIKRPPVVTIMGHVDHGKTSLLDALRETNVASGEAGGITQHIGAYQVTTQKGDLITFIDTPGHEAFTQMRARGAQATDIVILVVAADDGIQPQTIEAINHAKAAGVPIIVAVNKIDKPDSNPDRIAADLLQYEIQVESMGGEIQSVFVSALKRTGLDELLESILIQAELLDIKANPNRMANGIIIEARMERGRGVVATVLIQGGTLAIGSIFIGGAESGRVRALANEHGKNLVKAGPGTPVEILGFQGLPNSGDEFIAMESEVQARQISVYRQEKNRQANITIAPRGTLEQMLSQIRSDNITAISVVIKTDVHGSMEALKGSLEKILHDEVRVNILHGAVGGITESDVQLALTSQALVIGFNVRANPQARALAAKEHVDIRYYSIIYDIIDDIKKMMSDQLSPEERETRLGYAEIREVFNISKLGKIAGCIVTEGIVKRGSRVRIVRDNVVVYTGALKQLKRFKDDAREVQSGTECGLSFDKYDDLKASDVIECFDVEEISRSV